MIEKGYGFPVEFVTGKTVNMWQAMRLNQVEVYMEAWTANMMDIIEPAMEAGDVVELSTSNNDNWQSLFVVPTYVIKGDSARGISPMAPDLKSAADLEQEQYKELFQDPEDKSKGRIFSCLPGWACELINMEQLAAYGLDDDYNLINPGSQEALFAGLMGAYEKGEPYITYLWGPTWIAGKLDLTVLEEPPHDEAVWETTRNCAYPSSPIKIYAYKDFPAKAPAVAEMFGKWKLNTKTLGEGLAYMDDTGGEPADAAVWFLKEKEAIWTEFVPSDVAQKIKDAVAGM
jgi:glycine betaine/proline transport system substrate-binding protein